MQIFFSKGNGLGGKPSFDPQVIPETPLQERASAATQSYSWSPVWREGGEMSREQT